MISLNNPSGVFLFLSMVAIKSFTRVFFNVREWPHCTRTPALSKTGPTGTSAFTATAHLECVSDLMRVAVLGPSLSDLTRHALNRQFVAHVNRGRF